MSGACATMGYGSGPWLGVAEGILLGAGPTAALVAFLRRPPEDLIRRTAAARCAQPGDVLAAWTAQRGPFAQLVDHRAQREAQTALGAGSAGASTAPRSRGAQPARSFRRLAPSAALGALLLLVTVHVDQDTAFDAEPQSPAASWLAAEGAEAVAPTPPPAAQPRPAAGTGQAAPTSPNAPHPATTKARRDALALTQAAAADPRLREAIASGTPEAFDALADSLRSSAPSIRNPEALRVAQDTAEDAALKEALDALLRATAGGDAAASAEAVEAVGKAFAPLRDVRREAMVLTLSGSGTAGPGAGSTFSAPTTSAAGGAAIPSAGSSPQGSGQRVRTPREQAILGRYFQPRR